MFSLILSLLVVVLIGVMGFAATYYMGGSTFTAKDKATAATVINGAAQIDGAIKLYKAQHRGDVPESLEAMVDEGYLKSVPDGEWTFGENSVTNSAVSDEICHQVNERLHNDRTIPECSESTSFMGCCSVPGEGES